MSGTREQQTTVPRGSAFFAWKPAGNGLSGAAYGSMRYTKGIITFEVYSP